MSRGQLWSIVVKQGLAVVNCDEAYLVKAWPSVVNAVDGNVMLATGLCLITGVFVQMNNFESSIHPCLVEVPWYVLSYLIGLFPCNKFSPNSVPPFSLNTPILFVSFNSNALPKIRG